MRCEENQAHPEGGTPGVMIIAGEASGDLHGAYLVREMLALHPGLRFCGIGGNRMKEAGVELLAHAADIAVVGVSEVFSKITTFVSIISRIKKTLDTFKPQLVILIDFPDFNLHIVAPAAKKRNIPIFYYISPQVWAWRSSRVEKIKRLVKRMAVILPFEVDFYAARGYCVDYVGHPLLETVRSELSKSEAQDALGLQLGHTTIGLLPGSRTAEIERLLPEMMGAAKIILQQMPEAQFILPLADTLKEDRVRAIISASGVSVRIVPGRMYDVLASCDLAIVTSGTATLETGLMGVPMIIIYRLSVFSAIIGKLILRPQLIGLVNIIAGKMVAPELIQLDANAKRIASEALAILTNEEKKQVMIAELSRIRAKMGSPGAARRAAQIACDML